jgi:hypothetical protein
MKIIRNLLAWWAHFMKRWLFSDAVARWVITIGAVIVIFEILRAFARGAFAGVIR